MGRTEDIVIVDHQGWNVGPVAMDLIRLISFAGSVEEFQAGSKTHYLYYSISSICGTYCNLHITYEIRGKLKIKKACRILKYTARIGNR